MLATAEFWAKESVLVNIYIKDSECVCDSDEGKSVLVGSEYFLTEPKE